MPGGRVQVQGLGELRRDLRRIDPELTKGIPKTLSAAAGIVAREARARAPKRSGKLERSIKVRVRRNTAFVVVTARRPSKKYPQGYPYGRRIEFAVKAYLLPALEAKRDEVERRLEGLLDDIIDRVERG